MPNWNKVLNFAPFYHAVDMTIAMKAQRVAQLIRAKFPRQLNEDDVETLDEDLLWIVEMFENLAEETLVSPDRFDDVMAALYDWADFTRVWVVTR